MYKLFAEDLSKLGGPMGTETTSVIFTRYFDSIEKAKQAAEIHFRRPIKWVKTRGDKNITSGDLGWVMYTVYKIKAE